MDFIVNCFMFALKLLAIGIGLMVFKEVLCRGKGTFRDLIETAGLGIQAGCALLRKKLITILRKETGKPLEQVDQTAVEAEGTVE